MLAIALFVLTALPITDSTSAGWRPPSHDLKPGIYASAHTVLVVKRDWVHEWSFAEDRHAGEAFGAIRDGWFVRSRSVPEHRASLPLDTTRRQTRLRQDAEDLCAGEGCEIRLHFLPARFDKPFDSQSFEALGWQGQVQPMGLAVAMDAQAATLQLRELRPQLREAQPGLHLPLSAFQPLSHEPQRDYGEGLLRWRDGIYHGWIQGAAAPAPTAVPIVHQRFVLAWRRADGGMQLWLPHPDKHLPVSQSRWPWLVNLNGVMVFKAPSNLRRWAAYAQPQKGWPETTPETVGCRCTAPPCDPYDAPRLLAMWELKGKGRPYMTSHWICDRPNATRQWSLAPLGVQGVATRLLQQRNPVVLHGPDLKTEVHGRLGQLDPRAALALGGKTTLTLEPRQDGALVAHLIIEYRLQGIDITGQETRHVSSVGPARRHISLWMTPKGWRLERGDMAPLLLAREDSRFVGEWDGTHVHVERLADGTLWIFYRQDAALPPIDS